MLSHVQIPSDSLGTSTTDCLAALFMQYTLLCKYCSYLACKCPLRWVRVEGLCPKFCACLQLLVKKRMPAGQIGVIAVLIVSHIFGRLEGWCACSSLTSESILPQRAAERPHKRHLQHSRSLVGWFEGSKAGALTL